MSEEEGPTTKAGVEERVRQWLELAAGIAGVIAVLAGVVYFFGAYVVGLRLVISHLPATSIVTQRCCSRWRLIDGRLNRYQPV